MLYACVWTEDECALPSNRSQKNNLVCRGVRCISGSEEIPPPLLPDPFFRFPGTRNRGSLDAAPNHKHELEIKIGKREGSCWVPLVRTGPGSCRLAQVELAKLPEAPEAPNNIPVYGPSCQGLPGAAGGCQGPTR